MSRSKAYEWHRCFKEGRYSIEGNERIGRPPTSRNMENVGLVPECVHKDRFYNPLNKLLRLHISRRRRLRESIHRTRPQFWQSNN
ncbi:hypothetical protein TNCV_1736871 [Trichonephila clavipes]|nr:hypothetical protein TNCV_1736871 [Trichonephila clavipes]